MEDGKSIIWQIQIEILGSPPLNIYIPDKNVWTKLKYHSANPTTLQLIPKLREIIRSAIPIFSEENEDKSKPNIKAYHNDGTIFYDGEATELKKVQELQNQPYRTPIAGEELSAPSNNKLLRFFAPVNNNSWRQV